MIEAHGIEVTIGKAPILKDVSCRFASGINALIGPNGAGKSTLLSCLSGMRRPEQGTVLFEGGDVSKLAASDLAMRRALVVQSAGADGQLLVRDIVELGRFARRLSASSAENRRAIDGAIGRCGLVELSNRRYGSLSGGEKQRVHLARALAQVHECKTPVLFLDEPTAALDPGAAYSLFAMLRRWLDDVDGLVIAVLHDLNLCARYADHVVMMNRGAVLCEGSCEEAFSQSNLEHAYSVPFHLTEHPEDGRPVVLGPVLG